MKTILKILASFFLLLNGIGAVYGGINLIIFPDGSSLHLSPDLLLHTPFHNYLIPGIILLLVNGIFSCIVLMLLILNRPHYARFVILEGVILTGWIIIQILLIRTVYFLHIILGAAGLVLIISGWGIEMIKRGKRGSI